MRTLLAAVALSLAACSASVTVDAGTVTCRPEETACGPRCANLRLDDEHCGACGVVCPADQACAGGACYPRECPSVDCSSAYACVRDSCAERECVGVQCPLGEACFEGLCRSAACGAMTCPEGTVCEHDRCLDLSCAGVLCAQNEHCEQGACTPDSPCLGAPDGTTCAFQQVCRAAECVVCLAGEPCVAAAACREGQTDCSTGVSSCEETGPSPDGTPCNGGSCQAGTCVGCDGGSCDAGTALPPTTVSFVSSAKQSPNPHRMVYQFTGMALGAPAPNRVVVVAVLASNPISIVSVVVGSVSATRAAVYDLPGMTGMTGIYYAAVPTGTTATVSVALTDLTQRCAIGLYRVLTQTPDAPVATSPNPGWNGKSSVSLAHPKDAVGIWVGQRNGSASFGVTVDGVTPISDGAGPFGSTDFYWRYGRVGAPTAGTSVFSADFGGGSGSVIAAYFR